MSDEGLLAVFLHFPLYFSVLSQLLAMTIEDSDAYELSYNFITQSVLLYFLFEWNYIRVSGYRSTYGPIYGSMLYGKDLKPVWKIIADCTFSTK